MSAAAKASGLSEEQAAMLQRLSVGKYFLHGAYEAHVAAGRKATMRALLEHGQARTIPPPHRYAITEDGTAALEAWRAEHKERLDRERKEFWARYRASKKQTSGDDNGL